MLSQDPIHVRLVDDHAVVARESGAAANRIAPSRSSGRPVTARQGRPDSSARTVPCTALVGAVPKVGRGGSYLCPSGIRHRPGVLTAQRAAETLDGGGGGRSRIDEHDVNRALDVCPRAASGGGHALEGPRGLALLRLQDAQVGARLLA